MKLSNTTNKSSEDIINNIQELKEKTTLKLCKKTRICYDEMKKRIINFEKEPFYKNSQGISKYRHEVLLLMKFSKTKPHIKNMKINYYGLFHTVIENRVEKGIVNDECEIIENDCNKFVDIGTPNHYFGIKPLETILR